MSENAVASAAGDLMGKKYFGVPFPVILLGVAGSVYLFQRYRRGNSDTVVQPETEGFATDVSGNKFASAYTGEAGGIPFGSGIGASAGTSTNTNSSATTNELDNDGWVRRATEKLNLLGHWNVIDIQTALQTYISGGKLDQRQAAIVEQATKVEGIPPINVVPGSLAPAAPAAPTLPTGNITRFIRRPDSPGIFAQYTNGVVVLIPNLRDLNAAASNSGNPNLYNTKTKQVVIKSLSATDPVWATTSYFQKK